MVSNISPLIAMYLWLMIPNVVSIQVLTSSSSNQSPLEIPDEAPNPSRFGTVSAPCQFVSGKVLVYLKLIFILNCLHEKVAMR